MEVVTWLGLNIIDTVKMEAKSIAGQEKTEDILYEPISNALNLSIFIFIVEYTYKSDLQSLLYVLVKMATGDIVFSLRRLKSEWVTNDNIKKWKIHYFFS